MLSWQSTSLGAASSTKTAAALDGGRAPTDSVVVPWWGSGGGGPRHARSWAVLTLIVTGGTACLSPSAENEGTLALPASSSASLTLYAAPTSVGLPVARARKPQADTELPRPRRHRHHDAVRRNAQCVECHPTTAASWRSSRHAQSFTNAAFTRGYAAEPRAFCSDCHAPELDPEQGNERVVHELGVGCVTCHLTDDDAILAAPGAASARANAVPLGQGADHPVRRSQAFAGLGACAACHEFRFPGRYGDDPESFMQTTVSEHLASPASNKPCARCHMPVQRGSRSHAFAETRDPEWLRRKLTAVAERQDRQFRITLAQTSPGHGFPTGDLFRRLEVGITLVDATGTTVHREQRYLARHFVIEPGTPGRRLVSDNRVFDEPTTVDFAIPGDHSTARVEWWVTYQRVLTPGTGWEPESAVIESEIRLHSGEHAGRSAHPGTEKTDEHERSNSSN